MLKQVPLTQGNQKVQTLAPQGDDETFAIAIREGTPIGTFQNTQSQLFDGLILIGGKDAVAIVDEILIGMVRWDRFLKLLQCPGRRWVIRDMHV